MDRLRILHCLETVGSGGVEQLRLTLARELDRHRYEKGWFVPRPLAGFHPCLSKRAAAFTKSASFARFWTANPTGVPCTSTARSSRISFMARYTKAWPWRRSLADWGESR